MIPLSMVATLMLVGDGQGIERPSTPQSSAIVVTGTRLTRDQAQRRASEFTRAVGFGIGDRPVARWEDPVCLSIQGLETHYASVVEREMRSIATSARVRLADARCEPNVTVHFTRDPVSVMRAVESRASHYLREVAPEDRERLVHGDGAIRWIYTTETRGADGRELTTGAGILAPGVMRPDTLDGSGITFAQPLPSNLPVVFAYGAASVSTGTQRRLGGAAAVIDLNRLDGQTLQAVAAYAAMVTFAEIRPAAHNQSGSILSLFEPDGNRPGLSDWDHAFLSTLYRLPLDRRGRRHRAIMMRELVAAMTATGAAQR